MSILSNNLIYLRGNSNLSQEDIAKSIGIHRSTYGAYENDRNEPSIETLIKLSEIFKVSINDLCKLSLMKRNKDGLGKEPYNFVKTKYVGPGFRDFM